MTKLLILGSNSFGGASYCKYALENGHHIIGCSRSEQVVPTYRIYKDVIKNDNFSFEKIDLNQEKDIKALSGIIDTFKPKIIINFSAQSMVAESWASPVDWMNTNVSSLTQLMEMLRYKDFDRYIHFSTPEVYGSNPDWLKENRNYSPSTPYALSRAAGDMIVDLWGKTYEMPVNITRASTIYGPGQQVYRLITKTILCILNKQKFPLEGNGTSVRSFVHMKDVSNALELIMLDGRIGDHYHISTCEIYSVVEIIEKICTLLNTQSAELVEYKQERVGKDQMYLLDSNKARVELKWQDLVSIDDGLEECIEWVKTNLKELNKLPSRYVHKK